MRAETVVRPGTPASAGSVAPLVCRLKSAFRNKAPITQSLRSAGFLLSSVSPRQNPMIVNLI
jgi:hypothetical protein